MTIWSNGETVLRQLGVNMDGAGQLLVQRAGADVHGAPARHLGRDRDGEPAGRTRSDGPASRPAGTAAGRFPDRSHPMQLARGRGRHHTRRRAGRIRRRQRGRRRPVDRRGRSALGGSGHVVGAQPAEPTGWCSWQGLVTLPDVVDDKRVAHDRHRRARKHRPVAGRGLRVQWWFDLPWSCDFVRPQRPIEVIRSNFTGWSDSVDLRARAIDRRRSGPSPYPAFSASDSPAAVNAGPVTLLGDAAHTMPPTLAQGTNQALLDTMVLCKALSDLRSGNEMPALRGLSLPGRCAGTRRPATPGRAVSRVASLQVAHGESVLRPAALISDRLHTWALTMFVRLDQSPPDVRADRSRPRGAATAPSYRRSMSTSGGRRG